MELIVHHILASYADNEDARSGFDVSVSTCLKLIDSCDSLDRREESLIRLIEEGEPTAAVRTISKRLERSFSGPHETWLNNSGKPQSNLLRCHEKLFASEVP